jgi:hypothetical protein
MIADVLAEIRHQYFPNIKTLALAKLRIFKKKTKKCWGSTKDGVGVRVLEGLLGVVPTCQYSLLLHQPVYPAESTKSEISSICRFQGVLAILYKIQLYTRSLVLGTSLVV